MNTTMTIAIQRLRSAASTFALLCIVATPVSAVAQQTDGAAKVQRLIDLAGTAERTTNDGVRLPQRENGNRATDDVGYDLRQHPTPPPQLNLSTTIETHVDNKTTNNVSGGGATGRAGDTTPAPSSARPHAIDAAVEFRSIVAQSLG